jgi:uncharacterized protein YbaP (TraB family)
LRLIGGLFVAFALLAGCAAAAHAGAAACSGRNIVDDLQASDPAKHARVLAAAARTENANAILWRVEKAGAPASHLFGTIHLTDERIAELSPAVTAALEDARSLLLELDDLSPDAFSRQIAGAPQLASLMLYTDGRRLDQLIGGADYATLSGALSRAGVPAHAVGRFRPWMATLMLSVSECEQQRMRAGLLPLDARLARDAGRRGIKAVGLETVESQLRALSSVPERDQIEILKSTVRHYHRVDDLIETMVHLYLRRRIAVLWPLQLALAEEVGVSRQVFESYERSLLVVRNLKMRDSALPYLAKGGAFIGVGALHLPGKHGLVALLGKAGYSVTGVE